MDAFHHYGITRLAARVYELRLAGHDVLTYRETVKERTSIARYRLGK